MPAEKQSSDEVLLPSGGVSSGKKKRAREEFGGFI
jgi:hypothetical protein